MAKLQIRTGNLSIELKKSKVKLKLIFFFKFKSELNGFYFYCVAFSIRLGHERKVIEANLKNNPEQLRGTIFS
jgi:hypothetical protein